MDIKDHNAARFEGGAEERISPLSDHDRGGYTIHCNGNANGLSISRRSYAYLTSVTVIVHP